ncbi:uncharacterized protein [Palaemon carinicauda]|uniref:uncharacterized protein n=1 Tax=Palaemon carinicauda TaxID=392227 RepID=UPI0035B5F84C
MLPTNVISLMKKMVTSEGVPNQGSYTSGTTRTDGRDSGTTLSKLKQHLTSGLGTVSKLSTTRSTSNSSQETSTPAVSAPGLVHQQSVVSSEDRSLLQKVWDRKECFDPTDTKLLPPLISTPTAPSLGVLGSGGGGGGAPSPLTSPTGAKAGEGGGLPIPMRPGRDPGSSCRVCVKTLGESEFFKVCDECGNKVCEDCASYSSSQSNEGEEKWNCSICRRRLSSRAKLEKPPSIEGLGITPQIPPIMSSPLPPPSPGAPAALNIFAAMASTMGAPNKNATSLTPNFAAVSGDAALTTGQPLANGYANYRRRSVWAVSPQKSVEKPKILERSKSKDDACKDVKIMPILSGDVNREPRASSKGPPPGEGGREGRAPSKAPGDGSREPRSSSKAPPGERPEGRRQRDKSRERNAPPRRAHDDDHLRPSSRMRHRRSSDYRIHEARANELLPVQTLHAARSEMDISKVRRKSCTNIQMTRPPDFGSNRMVNGTGGDDSPEKWRQKGRRKSIRRQQSYDEEEHAKEKEPCALSPWAAGEPPVRRHSMQGPTRREEALEAHKRAKQSLDTPHYGRDGAKDSLGMSSSSGDVSNEPPSDRGSSTANDDTSHTSNRRRSSYRASRDMDQEPDQAGNEDQSESYLGCQVFQMRKGQHLINCSFKRPTLCQDIAKFRYLARKRAKFRYLARKRDKFGGFGPKKANLATLVCISMKSDIS